MLTLRLSLLLTVPPLLWAGNSIIGSVLADQVGAMTLNNLRWWLAFLFLLPLGWRVFLKPAQLWQQGRWRHLLCLGFLAIACYNAFQYLALQTSSAINVTLIAASGPIWSMLIGAVVYRVPVSLRELLGAGLSLMGVMLVLARGDWQVLLATEFVLGDVLMVLAIICWCSYSWALAKPPESMRDDNRPQWGWAEFLLVQIGFGLVATSAGAGVEWAILPEVIQWSPGLVLALFYMAIGPSLVAYRCWGIGVAKAGPTIAAFFANLIPVFTAILSTLLLQLYPQWFHYTAFLFIAAGIWLSR